MNENVIKNRVVDYLENNNFILHTNIWDCELDDYIDIEDSTGYKYNYKIAPLYISILNNREFQKFTSRNKYSFDNIILWVSLNCDSFSVLDGYYNGAFEKTIQLQCFECGNTWFNTWSNIKKDRKCPYCAGKLVFDKNNLSLVYPKLVLDWSNKNEKDISEYTVSSGKKVFWKCHICSQEWKTTIASRSVDGIGCPYCSGKKAYENNNFESSYPEIAREWNYELNTKLPNEYTPGSSKSVYWKCYQCSHVWYARITARARGAGCPACSMSGGAKKIYYFLQKKNIPFYIEYEFKDLVSSKGNPLRYDFCIVDENDNVICLIEFDGDQHTQFFKHIHKTIERFKKGLYHDQLKNKYAEDNGIPLLRFNKESMDDLDIILNYI